MHQDLGGWVAAQRDAIVANWRRWDVPPIVAIEGPHVVGTTYGGPEGRATSWVPLGNTPSNVAMIQLTGAVTSLWVDPAKNNYVDLFRKFLKDHCHVDDSQLTKDFDVDHMYNRERAKNFGYGFVRMFPIRKGPNRSHGAGFEKAMTASDIGRRRKVMKLMDEVSTMKFFGILSPSSSKGFSAVQRAHMRTMADLFDLTIEQIEEGVNGLMQRAHRK
jgi:hypothetical protein